MKFHTPRSSFIPSGAVKVASKASSAVVYLSERMNAAGVATFYAVGFYGKADKYAFNFSFWTAERRTHWVSEWMRDRDAQSSACRS